MKPNWKPWNVTRWQPKRLAPYELDLRLERQIQSLQERHDVEQHQRWKNSGMAAIETNSTRSTTVVSPSKERLRLE